ncbi:unnamed protein product [Protopolystoma xenopodis]|uniref:COP9 signalosome complex subunit 5 n=1 Tax=Protopolystoma xenopodis TaxID=117903 RepID=A0A3S4ZDJ5_9PLAT|nr:unnamed protein product [Protopolystoma xenopodis]
MVTPRVSIKFHIACLPKAIATPVGLQSIPRLGFFISDQSDKDAEAYEYMTTYKEIVARVGRTENVLGWYHSHPGYGCWLSGIDVSTQMMNQTYQEPFVAIVIDPIRTISSGKVNLAAFRTYPFGYRSPDEEPSEYQSIPMDKIEDFGVHCKQYYALTVSHFKSVLDRRLLDLLWNKYWVNTLSSVSILAQPDYLSGLTRDLAEKVEHAVTSVSFMLLTFIFASF